MRQGVFVTGTDTGIGKTVVSACLVRRWGAEYWKPLQTGLAEEAGDSHTVAHLAQAPAHRIHPPRYAFQAPLSPEAAAAAKGQSVAISGLDLPPGDRTLVVEGAGGVLVPLGGGLLMADLMARLGLPAVLVARTTLGTINHTLLSLEALRARFLAVWGVVLAGPDHPGNAEAIARLGRVRILARLEPLAAVTPAAVAEAALAMPAHPPARETAGTGRLPA